MEAAAGVAGYAITTCICGRLCLPPGWKRTYRDEGNQQWYVVAVVVVAIHVLVTSLTTKEINKGALSTAMQLGNQEGEGGALIPGVPPEQRYYTLFSQLRTRIPRFLNRPSLKFSTTVLTCDIQ